MASTFFPVKRTLDSHQGFVADMKINLRRFRITVTKKCLDILPFHALLHQMCCKAVSEAVGELLLLGSSASDTARRITCSRVLTVR